MNGKNALGAALVVIGGLMVMKFLGIHLGWIVGLLMPFILIGLGVVGVRNNSKVVGAILIVVGGLMLLPKLFGLLSLLIALALIVAGVAMFKNRQNRV
ncbi:LiaF transmembrane domain-containing protein [Paenibacillus sacheonensis]|uniref:LiaF transmembrane domain-containing protein n=1 Tax=Paenibacillus sacheonensis TaxID=742054 RepID=A0A7X5BZR6_9BACL|nr:hypothetical protein [Paenibacillus sacheonensis]MBM7569114.1 putative membrane protein [Paenibacillus sacheonensis]NBC72948.1 hypothetical protein [Paenibacillus sacheonensis]